MRYVLMKVHRYDHMVYVDFSEVIEFRDPVIERRQQEIAQQHNVDLVKHVVVLCVRKNNKTAIDKCIVTASPSSLILSGRAVQIRLHHLRSSVLVGDGILRIQLAPHFKSPVHAVNLGKILFNKILRCTLAAIAVITINDECLVGISLLNKSLQIVVI